jgi:hypothetical protein
MAHNPTHDRDPDADFPMPVGEGLVGTPSPGPLVAPQLLALARRIADARPALDRAFGRGLCTNPPLNILLDLFIAGEDGRNVTIKSACVAAGAPQSTALRHIAHLIDLGLAVRSQHPSDARSAFLRLSERGRTRMLEFLAQAAHPGA